MFSIITVCFNSEKTMEKTLKSVLEQNCNCYEYIIVDGKSTDSTLDIINKYKEVFGSKISIVSEKDTGIYNAMNKGIKAAKGDYICFLNSDDWFEPDILNKLIPFIQHKCDVEAIYGDVNRIADLGGKIIVNREKAGQTLKMLRRGMIFSHQSLFVKREVFSLIGGFDESFRIAGDWDFVIRMWKRDMNFIYFPMVISNFAIGGACGKKHLLERSKVRRKNGFYRMIDYYLIREAIHTLKTHVLKIVFRRHFFE